MEDGKGNQVGVRLQLPRHSRSFTGGKSGPKPWSYVPVVEEGVGEPFAVLDFRFFLGLYRLGKKH